MDHDQLDRREWVRRYYSAADVLDPDAFVADLSEDVRICARGGETVGRHAVRAAVEQARATGLRSMRHEIGALWMPEPDVVIAEARVSYAYAKHTLGPFPVVTIFRWHNARVSDVRVYMDSSVRGAAQPPSAASG
jgi:SnoaL-like protein